MLVGLSHYSFEKIDSFFGDFGKMCQNIFYSYFYFTLFTSLCFTLFSTHKYLSSPEKVRQQNNVCDTSYMVKVHVLSSIDARHWAFSDQGEQLWFFENFLHLLQ